MTFIEPILQCKTPIPAKEKYVAQAVQEPKFHPTKS
jgi:hypothetical protein